MRAGGTHEGNDVTNDRGASIWMEPGQEAELVVAAQAGDRAAFLELARFYQRMVYRVAYAMTLDAEDAAALTRDTFVHAWQGLKGFPDRRRFLPWVLGTARNLAVTLARQRAGDGTRFSEPPLLVAYRGLPPDEQMALALRVVERLPYTEIADLLELPSTAAIVRLSSARGFLFSRSHRATGENT